jgi:Fe-S-cluster containining protein
MEANKDKDSSSICETCVEPGACCKELTLSVNGRTMRFHSDTWIKEATDEMAQRGFSFLVPVGKEVFPNAPSYVSVKFKCTKLGEDGRCTDYANRPGFCRTYEPGVEELCVMYKPKVTESNSMFKEIPITFSSSSLTS